MDNLTHTLVGAVLAETGLKKHTRLATATLVLAANAPDVDVVSYAWGEPVALAFRRGWTHGVLALVVLPVLVASAVLAWHRAVRHWRGRDRAGDSDLQPVRPWVVFGLAALGVATHPVLDGLNTYGMRWLMPFDGRWFYGDTLFIIDPWLWLLLGGAVFLIRSRRWWALGGWAAVATLATVLVLGPDFVPVPAQVVWLVGVVLLVGARAATGPLEAPVATRLALLATILAVGYTGAMGLASRHAVHTATRQLTEAGNRPGEGMMAGPLPADPFGRDIVARLPGAYWTGSFRWQRELKLIAGRPPIRHADDDPVVRAALATREARLFLGWARFPFVEVDTAAAGYTVYVLDARYTRARTRGFGSTVIELDRALVPQP